jgi:two-component system sensor histidine kinase GlrK
MVIGYLAVFIPVAALSLYAFSHLTLFRSATDEILRIDHRIRDLGEILSDSVLAQTRYEKKYVITRDKELHDRFVLLEKEVSTWIDEGISIADTPRKKEALIRIKDYYHGYKTAFYEEAASAGKRGPYPRATGKEKKGLAIDGILGELRNLKRFTEQDTRERMKLLGESGARVNKIALVMGGLCILSGIAISVLITRSITRPLSCMREKTRQVAGGDFGPPLNLSSPPEMRELAEDFNLMCNKLYETDKIKNDFFSLMAHELRMPLASIKEGTSLLLKGIGEEFREKRREVLTIIAEESNHLIDLVNSLLDLSRMEAGMMTLDLQPAEMEPLVRKAASALEPLAMGKNVDIHIGMPADLPRITVDIKRIGQVLRNLIGNAVKFTPVGGNITVSAQSVEGGLMVSVADTGPGIAEEDLSTIFDKFQQAAVTKYNKIKGTGMGLAIVKHIINAHGGKVWAESESGRGSTFIFLLPA